MVIKVINEEKKAKCELTRVISKSKRRCKGADLPLSVLEELTVLSAVG